MAIQYAGGTIVNNTFTQVAGTRAELAQWIRDQLVVAGWTSSGSATDYQLTCALTPQSLQGRVRVYDPGSGSCARLKFSNVSGSRTQAGDLFLLPAAAKVWRIIANRYQFFVMTAGASPTREFACGGVLYVPSFLGATECIWSQGNAISDTDVNFHPSFRSGLVLYQGSNFVSNGFYDYNGTVFEANGLNDNLNPGSQGEPRLIVMTGAGLSTAQSTVPGYRWMDDSQLINDALIAWGLTAYNVEAKLAGQLWDAAVLSDAWVPDTVIQVDPVNPLYNFMTITANNVGTGGTYARGTLCVRTS